MLTNPKPVRRRRPEPRSSDPWLAWIDMALSIGRAIVSCERIFAEVALAPPAPAGEARRAALILIHSSAKVSGGARRPPPALRLVNLRGRRNGGTG